MRDRVKRMLGFVLVATIEGPPRSPRQTHSALKAAIGVRRPLPVAAHQHFIPRGWPAPAMGTHFRRAPYMANTKWPPMEELQRVVS